MRTDKLMAIIQQLLCFGVQDNNWYTYTGWPKKVCHYQIIILSRIKSCQSD